jgi:hypothetical protein
MDGLFRETARVAKEGEDNIVHERCSDGSVWFGKFNAQRLMVSG